MGEIPLAQDVNPGTDRDVLMSAEIDLHVGGDTTAPPSRASTANYGRLSCLVLTSC
jgi:hypothetical protein